VGLKTAARWDWVVRHVDSWFNISRRPDWVATRLFFQARALAAKKSNDDDKCGFVSIGTGSYDPSPQLLAAYRNDPEAGVKMNVDDYVLNMKASSAFDQCYTFTYTTERTLPMVQQALAGVRQALVRPLWADADTTLDTEFNKITSSLVEGTIFVKSHLRSFESDLLAGFKTGLASGRVGAIVRLLCTRLTSAFWLLLSTRSHAYQTGGDDRCGSARCSHRNTCAA
jgi:hypothetical protein